MNLKNLIAISLVVFSSVVLAEKPCSYTYFCKEAGPNGTTGYLATVKNGQCSVPGRDCHGLVDGKSIAELAKAECEAGASELYYDEVECTTRPNRR